jgi:hypothetical protein
VKIHLAVLLQERGGGGNEKNYKAKLKSRMESEPMKMNITLRES